MEASTPKNNTTNNIELYTTILNDIKKHVPAWNVEVITTDNVSFTRLSGLSNACYRVLICPENASTVEIELALKAIEPQTLLFRFFECAIVNWQMENEVFKTLSDQGIGPKLYHQNKTFRIEGFFLSRPLTIFEMRNDIFMDAFAEKICDFNYNKKVHECVLKYSPIDKLYIDECINEWHLHTEAKLPQIKEAFKEHPDILQVIDEF